MKSSSARKLRVICATWICRTPRAIRPGRSGQFRPRRSAGSRKRLATIRGRRAWQVSRLHLHHLHSVSCHQTGAFGLTPSSRTARTMALFGPAAALRWPHRPGCTRGSARCRSRCCRSSFERRTAHSRSRPQHYPADVANRSTAAESTDLSDLAQPPINS
jgi:hypothetical protein